MKLFFLDIDGTIAMPGTAPSPLLLQTVAALRAQGDKVFLCTGRTYHSVPEPVRPLGTDGGIFSAGGLILDGTREIYRCYMSKDCQTAIVSLLERLGAHYVLECAEQSYWGGSDLQDTLSHLTPGQTMHSELLRLLTLFHRYRPLEAYRGEPVYKIVFLLPSRQQAAALQREAPTGTNTVFFQNLLASGDVFLGEISDGQITKGNAIHRMCARYGLTPEDCVAYGDSMNDASALRAVGEGIAMGNANQEIKALASRVCGSCAEDGLAKDLRRFLK